MKINRLWLVIIISTALFATFLFTGYSFKGKAIDLAMFLSYQIVLLLFVSKSKIKQKAIRYIVKTIASLFIIGNFLLFIFIAILGELSCELVHTQKEENYTYRIYQTEVDLCYFEKGVVYDYNITESLAKITLFEKRVDGTSCDNDPDHAIHVLNQYLKKK